MKRTALFLLLFFFAGILSVSAQETGGVYTKSYKPGKYRMTISVLKGEVVLANYDEKGPDYKHAITVIEGETKIVEGDIVFMML